MESSSSLFANARTSGIGSDLGTKGYLAIKPGTWGMAKLLCYAIMSATVLAILVAVGFTGSNLVASFFLFEEIKSITSLPIVDEPLRVANEVFIFFFTDDS
ncbi:hypothetical protein ACFX10_006971 [Malus domestica]